MDEPRGRVELSDVAAELLAADASRTSVLIVDDHPPNLVALQGILAPLDLNLVLATSGAEALRQLLCNEFALILLDVQMPGLDGPSTAALIKKAERTKHIPIVFLTAYGGEASQVIRAYREGAVDYLLKPFDPEALRAKVAVFVDLFEQARRVQRHSAELVERTRVLAHERGARAEAEAARRAREETLAVVSHDLRSPLASVQAAAHLLLRASPAGDPTFVKHRGYGEAIQRATATMSRLIEDLLDVARIEAGRLTLRPGQHAAGELARHAVELVRVQAVQRELSLHVEGGGDVTVPCDRERVSQVLSNLLGNAIKFTRDGGSIRVEIRSDGQEVLFSVSDTGLGIPKDQLPFVFQRYWQARKADREGLGIGLAIAKGIVEAHGGRIWVTSREGQSTTVCFTLPIQQPASAACPVLTHDRSASG